MQDTITSEQITAALQALGGTAEDVAKKLRFGGWLGSRHDSGCCPVARYLMTVVPELEVATVGSDHVRIFVTDGPAVEVDLTPAVAGFVLTFDIGAFPTLVSHDSDETAR